MSYGFGNQHAGARPAAQFAPQQANAGFAQPQQPNMYNLSDIARTTANFALNFNLAPMLDNMTPQVAAMVANEVQNQARRGHVVRTTMNDYISENGFGNAQFQELVWVVMMRIGFGLEAGEWRSPAEAAQAVVSKACRAYAGGLICFNQELFQQITADNQQLAAELTKDAQMWNYLSALANRTVAYEPFQQAQVVPTAPRSVAQNSPAVMNRNIGDTGAFVEQRNSVGYQPTQTAATGVNRYERIRENMLRQQEEEQQAREKERAERAGTASAGFGMNSALRSMNTQPEQAPQQTSFSSRVEEKPAAAEPLAVLTINGKEVRIVRIVADGAQKWKPSIMQPNRPAYSKRSHYITYCETDAGDLLACVTPLTKEQKEKLMNYDAHAIDPTLGRPVQAAKETPQREEAKVLYEAPEKVNVTVVIKSDVALTESKESAVKAAIVYAKRTDNAGACVITSAMVSTGIVFDDKVKARETLELLEDISVCTTLKEAGRLITKIKEPQLARIINESINQDINDFIIDGLGIRGASVSETVDTYSEELEDQLANFGEEGELYAKRFALRIPLIIRANTRAIAAMTVRNYADIFLAEPEEEAASPDIVERTLFLQRNVNVAYVPYTESELAIELSGNEACLIDKSTLPVIYEVVKQFSSSKVGLDASLSPDNYLVSSDGKLYKVVVGGFSNDTRLLKNA